MKKNRTFCLFLRIAILLLIVTGCNSMEEIPNLSPTCKIISPPNGYITEQGALITVLADAGDTDGTIHELQFHLDASFISSTNGLPFQYEWNTFGVDTGIHTLRITAIDDRGTTNTDEQTIYLTQVGSILAFPVAAFSSQDTQINEGSSVKFTDQSSNLPNIWVWEFGDGDTSTLQNPKHIYSLVGQYTVKLTATNPYGSNTITMEKYITVMNLETGSVTDYEGKLYKTVKIGNQWWMAENLNTRHFYNGTEIPLVESNSDWAELSYSQKAFCYYDNSSTHGTMYGALYTWSAAMNGEASTNINPSNVQGICPCGWHLPSDVEWMELEMSLGMSYVQAYEMGWRGTDEGDKMKSTSGWFNEGNGTNNSGFSALPGGQRADGTFIDLTQLALFWSSTEYFNMTHLAFNRTLSYAYPQVGWFRSAHYYGYPKNYGFSVRCIKD